MSQLGLHYISQRGLKGKIYFYITEKTLDDRGKWRYMIRVQEQIDGELYQVPLYDFLAFHSPQKARYTLYPKSKINSSELDFPYLKQFINDMFVYDVRHLRADLPLGLRMGYLDEVPPETSLDDIFGEVT